MCWMLEIVNVENFLKGGSVTKKSEEVALLGSVHRSHAHLISVVSTCLRILKSQRTGA